jgi:gluconate 2-dehydrogenase gamma chain
MLRRDLLRAAASAAALSLLPRDAMAAWSRSVSPAFTSSLTPAQQRLIAALADAILPRTDTPGATDVGVPAFIDVIVQDYYNDAERAEFTSGVAAIDQLSNTMTGSPFASLTGAQLVSVMNALDKPADRNTPAARGYSRIKGLVIHGYFTSERVQKDVFKTNIMPGRFDGSAPLPAKAGGRD